MKADKIKNKLKFKILLMRIIVLLGIHLTINQHTKLKKEILNYFMNFNKN